MERENLPVTICLFLPPAQLDRKSTRLNSSHGYISYAVFCLKKKKKHHTTKHCTPPYLTHKHDYRHHLNALMPAYSLCHRHSYALCTTAPDSAAPVLPFTQT